MLMDPFTVIAQIVNFAILAWALKHFLYDRVVEAMDEREASIAARIHEAEEREAEARAGADDYERRIEDLESERNRLLDEAREEADRHRRDLLEQARDEVERERRRWQHALVTEQEDLHAELRRHAAREVLELGRRALSDLSGADLEATVLSAAMDHLAEDDEARTALLDEGDDERTIVVRTAFHVDDDDAETVRRRLRELGAREGRPVVFERDPDLVLGVEIVSDSIVVDWNVADYLDRLGSSIDEIVATLEAETRGG